MSRPIGLSITIEAHKLPPHLRQYFQPVGGCGECYICKLVRVFREVWRVLRPDGTLWLNIGDSYTSGGRATHDPGHSTRHPAQPRGTKRPATPAGLKPKDLIGIPWMLAFALRSYGYYLRSSIIWHKPNVMPESVEDRPTTAHEHLFLLAKSERYFYDAEAIKEKASEDTHSRGRACHPKTAPAGSGIKANASFEAAIRQAVPYRNKRSVWTVPEPWYQLRHDLTPKQRSYVVNELLRRGLL